MSSHQNSSSYLPIYEQWDWKPPLDKEGVPVIDARLNPSQAALEKAQQGLVKLINSQTKRVAQDPLVQSYLKAIVTQTYEHMVEVMEHLIDDTTNEELEAQYTQALNDLHDPLRKETFVKEGVRFFITQLHFMCSEPPPDHPEHWAVALVAHEWVTKHYAEFGFPEGQVDHFFPRVYGECFYGQGQ